MLRHESSEASPADRGRRFGRACSDAVERTVAFYLRAFAEDAGLTSAEVVGWGERVGARLARVCPQLGEEIDGIAAGAGVREVHLLAVNARTELIAGGDVAGGRRKVARALPAECSVLGVLPERTAEGRLLLAQNWDYHPDAADRTVLWTIRHGEGRWTTVFTEAGMVGKIGLNDAGVGVAMNFLASDRDGGADGIPIHVLARRVLDECDTFTAALQLLIESSCAASSCLTVGWARDGHGALAAVELSPDGAQVVWPDERGVLVHTNHFLAPTAPGDAFLRGHAAASSLARLDELRRRLRSHDRVARADVEQLLRSSLNASHGVCARVDDAAPWAQRYGTLASVVIDPEQRRLWVSDGPPDATTYEQLDPPALTSAQPTGAGARRGHLVRYDHPESLMRGDPTLDLGDAAIARLQLLSPDELRELRRRYDADVERAAAELLQEPSFRAALERLPLERGAVILAAGDSITVDRWSWARLLDAALRRADAPVVVECIACGGATTTAALAAVDAHAAPFDHAVVLIGSNDCVSCATAEVPLLSDAESERNLAAIDATVRARTGRNAIFMVPPPIDAELMAADWYLGPQMRASPEPWLAAKQALARAMPRCLVDCAQLFGNEAPAALFADGLHPDLPAQTTIVRALVEAWAAEAQELG